jgi:asparagine synthase (glutamine-hydrolysing)
MFGVCGTFDPVVAAASARRLAPRGPDCETTFYKETERGDEKGEKGSPSISFAFQRLAINDLTLHGNQPMMGDRCLMICNGEIYNHLDIATDYHLATQSTSDCEVILRLYEKLRPETDEECAAFCRTFDGEFAFALYDLDTNRLLVARDQAGVRPLFVGFRKDTIGFASELKALYGVVCPETIRQFPPGHIGVWSLNKAYRTIPYTNLYGQMPVSFMNNKKDACDQIRDALVSAVSKRVHSSDQPICALLSGGLDSSLVCAIAAKELAPRPLHTFSIGMEGSTDLAFAQIVADHIQSIHHPVLVTPEEMLKAIPEVIRIIETYDMTSVRASTPNYLIAKYIRENTDFKVVLTGEYSDELFGGYLYFKKAPDAVAFDGECRRLLRDICYFDSLRADRCISSQGLEARVPFSDRTLHEIVLVLAPDLRCTSTIEKQLLREAFSDDANQPLLPDSVLWRIKSAFSDAVSVKENSWHHIIQRHIDRMISDEEFERNRVRYTHNTPETKEAYYDRTIFEDHYQGCSHVIPYFWLPKWCGDMKDPSARELKVFHETAAVPVPNS